MKLLHHQTRTDSLSVSDRQLIIAAVLGSRIPIEFAVCFSHVERRDDPAVRNQE